MNPWDLCVHLLNFSAPALAMALLLPLGARWVLRLQGPMSWWRQMLCQLLVGIGVLAGSMVVLGRDGKMAGYAALVVVAATLQWLLARGWRR